jgi:thioredoxin reductase (NADPH)
MSDPYEQRREQLFPVLSAAQIKRVCALGERRQVKAGEVLFDVGDRETRFFVVVSGAVEIFRPFEGKERSVVRHGPGQFTGEINMLSGRRNLVRGRVVEDGELVVVDREHLRALVQTDSEISEILMRAFILRRMALIAQGGGDMVLIGSRHSAATLELREFLVRNGQPFQYQDVDVDPDVQTLLDQFQVAVSEVPVVICREGGVLRNPSVEKLADELGLSLNIDAAVVRDLVVVGGGPAGLAAAVYGASEGLDVLVLEGTAPGGQAGTSSKIENYLGFPTGISGQALAGRALTQAQKFGAEVAIGRHATRLDCDSRPYKIFLANGEVVRTRAIVIATGAAYRKPDLPELARFEGLGVFYSATYLEAQMCSNDEVAVVGGGNSAGQAAVFLSQMAARVRVLVRGPGLAESMSRYLIQRLSSSPTVTLQTRTQIEALEGQEALERIRCRHLDSGETQTLPVRHVFMMTGAEPHTKWLTGCVELDAKGFVKTGADISREELERRWPLSRAPFLFETSIPGVFAVGDARANSTKRVASAVGEGSVSIQLVHRALQEL